MICIGGVAHLQNYVFRQGNANYVRIAGPLAAPPTPCTDETPYDAPVWQEYQRTTCYTKNGTKVELLLCLAIPEKELKELLDLYLHHRAKAT